MTMTPLNGLFHQATTQPDGIAFIYDDVVWTYHDLLTGAERLSRAFLFHGALSHLGSGLIDQSQKATAAAIQIADK